MLKNKSILYLTDNSLDEKLAEFCRKKLKYDKIISVSQRPIKFGKNVCVGEIGRSWMSLYKQILAGIEACETPYIGIAEHDCIYAPEHLNWLPLRDDTFYYNHNCWLVQWGGNHPELNGMYSYWPKRYALSQLVCHKDLLKQSTEEILNLLEMGLKVEKGLRYYGEPGLISDKFKDYVNRAFKSTVSGDSKQLQWYLRDYVNKYKSESFMTEQPNLDIRHSSNFTGAKRGKKRCFEIPYWGKFSEVIDETYL